jgi:hypothetical protein
MWVMTLGILCAIDFCTHPALLPGAILSLAYREIVLL